MVEVVWAEPAFNDLDAITDYIALDDPAAARSLVHRIFEHVDQLRLIRTAVPSQSSSAGRSPTDRWALSYVLPTRGRYGLSMRSLDRNDFIFGCFRTGDTLIPRIEGIVR